MRLVVTFSQMFANPTNTEDLHIHNVWFCKDVSLRLPHQAKDTGRGHSHQGAKESIFVLKKEINTCRGKIA